MRKINKTDFINTGWVNGILDKLALNYLIIDKPYQIPIWVKERVRQESYIRSNKAKK